MMPLSDPARSARGPAFRMGWVLSLPFLLLLPVFASGCRTGATGVTPARAFVVPEWSDFNIRTLAFLGVGSSTGDETDRLTAERIVEQGLRSDQQRFVVLGLDDARSRAEAAGAADAFDKVVKAWRDSRKADQFLVQDVCRAVGVDGIILGDLTDWEKKKAGVDTGGNSYSQVTLRLAIYPAKTGLLAWDAEKLARKEAVRLSAESIGDPIKTMDEEKRIAHQTTTAPEPPRPEDVALQALRSIMAAFPPRPAGR